MSEIDCQFDANLVLAINGKFDQEESSSALLRDLRTGEQQVLDFSFFAKYMHFRGELNDLENSEEVNAKVALPELRRAVELSYNDLRDYLKANLHGFDRVCELVLEARVKTACLISSEGGPCAYADFIFDSIDDMYFRKGESVGFVGAMAGSNALELVFNLDKIYAMVGSKFVWHKTRFVDTLEVDEVGTRESAELLIDFLSGGKGPLQKILYERAIKVIKDKAGDGNLVMMGKDLRIAKCIETPSYTVKGLRTKFAQEFQTVVDFPPFLQRFWKAI